MNLAQSFNGLAAALAPVIGARVILGQGATEHQLQAMSTAARRVALASEAASVKTPYFILGTILLLIAIAFALTTLPKIEHKETGKAKSKNILHAFKHKHLTWAVIAQFFYVGGQVCVFSLFVLYATKSAGITEMKAADYLGACGIAFLIGRFVGTFLMRYIKPNRLLTIYASINILLCMVAIGVNGIITVYAVILICFFMSVMFPTIFALGIADLGVDTEYGSSLLIMYIVGGAILPRLFGSITDSTGDIQIAYLVPLACFSIVAYFGWRGHKTVPKIDLEEEPAIGTTL